MFAPPVIKAYSKTTAASSNSPGHQLLKPMANRSRHGKTGQTNTPDYYQDRHEAGLAARDTSSASWDFGKIPVLSPDRPKRSHAGSTRTPLQISGDIQPKLAVGRVDDPLEREADAVADKVMRMPEPALSLSLSGGPPQLSPNCAACEEGGQQKLRMKPADAATPTAEATRIVHDVLRSPAQPLDSRTRAFMELRFGYDLSRVRVHNDALSEASARSINAKAYTVGNHLVFAQGQYAPFTSTGRDLLAHELTHSIQQGGGFTGNSGTATIVQRQPEDSSRERSWTERVGAWYDEKKWAAYHALIKGMKSGKDAALNAARSKVPSLPLWAQGAITTILDITDFFIDLVNALCLAIIGLAVGFVEGIAGLITGVVKLVYGLFKLIVDMIVAVLGKGEAFKEDLDAIANAVRNFWPGVKARVGAWMDRYKKASAEDQVLMGAELVGEIEAFLATFAFAGAKAAQAGSLTVPTGITTKLVPQLGGTAAREFAVTTTQVAAKPLAQASVIALQSSALGGGPGGTGGREKEQGETITKSREEGPYKDIEDGTRIEPGREFTPTQKKKIVAANRERHSGRLVSDDPADPYQNLSDPTKSVSPGMGGPPQQDPAMAAVDHIVPQAAGGTNSYGNARVISQYYNNLLRAKGFKK